MMRTCSYAPASFDRRRSAARQDCFARARHGKRRQREDDAPTASDGRRSVLDRLKRMRLASPPSSPTSGEERVDATAMMTDDELRALVAVHPHGYQQLHLAAAARDVAPFPAGYGPLNAETCTALVVFDPRQSRAIASGPRIELVDSDCDEVASLSSSEDESAFVRFEELPSDNDEPVDMDID